MESMGSDPIDPILRFVKMNSETGDPKAEVDDNAIDPSDLAETVVLDESAEYDETAVLDESAARTDNVGDVSVEINVEELIADIEANEDSDVARKKEIRQRLEDLVEEQSFESTYAIDLDEKSD
jgi:hypothetical protein